MSEMQEKSSSTAAGLSRSNSLSSLPETECDWPHLDTSLVPAPASVETCSSPSYWQIQSPQSTTAPASLKATPEHIVQNPNQHGVSNEHIASAHDYTWALDQVSMQQYDNWPASQMAAAQCYYQVAFLGGIEVRTAPSYDSPRTGVVLMQHEVFAVAQQVVGADGRVYLCLADGRGWVFDDSALVPHDPSVRMCSHYMDTQAAQFAAPMPDASEMYMQCPHVPYSGSDAFTNQISEVVMPQPAPQLQAQPREVLASTPSMPLHAATASPPVPMSAWYRVAYLGGINLRSGPTFVAPLTGVLLAQNDTFPVSEEVVGADGRVYLRLSDGRGWAFDDSALMPHDPSVKRGTWMQPAQAQPSSYVVGTGVLQEVQPNALQTRRRHAQPRGKRGGKRSTRRALNSSNKLGSASTAAEGLKS